MSGRRLLSGFFGLLVVGAMIGGSVWLQHRLNAGAELAARSELEALARLEATLRAGPAPKDWSMRTFIPASLLKSAVSAFDGSDIRLPMGKEAGDRVDGFVRIHVLSSELIPEDARLGVRLRASVSYEPDREQPWWAGATADVSIEAVMLPDVVVGADGTQKTRFKILPQSIGVEGGWWFFQVRVLGLLASVAANEVMIRLGSQLEFSVPDLPPPIEPDLNVNTSDFQGFGGGGGTNLVVSMTRGKEALKNLTMPHWAITGSGVWLLGGRSVGAATTESSDPVKDVVARRSQLAKLIAPFEKEDDLFELALSGEALRLSIDQLLGSSPLRIDLKTEKTSGVIVDATVLHNDKVLGNVGLLVKPLGDDFGTGTVQVMPRPAKWSTKGLSIETAVQAAAKVNLDLHLATGVGGGMGNNVTLQADGKTALSLEATFVKKELPQGTAIILQPEVPCAPIVVQAHPGAAPPFTGAWFVMSPAGLELDREIGGMKISPAVLADGLPIVIEAPVAKDKAGKPIVRDPHNTVVKFPRPYWSVTLSPKDVVVDEQGFVLRSSAAFALRDEKESDAEKQKRASLRQALAEKAPHKDCKSLSGLKLLGGDVQVSDLYKEIQYVAESLKAHAEVAKTVLKALTDLDPRNAPENLVKAADAMVSAAGKDFKHVLDEVTSVAQTGGNIVQNQINQQKQNPGRPPDPVGGAVYDGLKKLSDERLKSDITRIGDLGDGLGIYRFKYAGSVERYIGLLAQEVIATMPTAVIKRQDGYLCVDYGVVNAELAKRRPGEAVTSWLRDFSTVHHGLPCDADR